MQSFELRQKYLDFFRQKEHKLVPSAPLVPENDPSTLFISAGMHPLVPYLLGQPHPLGKRLCSVQKCLRTVDIDNVGDTTHNTFFEMLGNWSLGDYWKAQMIPWSFEFLTKELQIPVDKISVTCFAGEPENNIPKDDDSALLWQKQGIPSDRIYFLGREDNWWGPAGETGPCGPDSEMFFDTGKAPCGPECRPGCNCGKYFEIWNDVFMMYNKTVDGKYELLSQRNLDTGMGLERTLAVLNGFYDIYQVDTLSPIIQKIEELSGKSYTNPEFTKAMRVIADHLRAASFIIVDGIFPSNKEQGYVLRRLLRRSVRYGRDLGLLTSFTATIAHTVVEVLGGIYPELKLKQEDIYNEFQTEEEKFRKTLDKGLKEFEKELHRGVEGKKAFNLLQTFGFPPEMYLEESKRHHLPLKEKSFWQEFLDAQKEHQQLSRAGAEQKFKGGLADRAEITTKYHTATHLLQAALRQILGPHVHQEGSNITSQRLRFDFSHPDKLTPEQLQSVEDLVNQKIEADLPVLREEKDKNQAITEGALAFFVEKYPQIASVYTIGSPTKWFSKELCGGPHVRSTKEIGTVKIIKEEAVGTGRRRLYLQLCTAES